jgi:hypothetical protein
MSLRLFRVATKYFSNKRDAKAYRNEHGGHVSKGEDHWLFGVKREPSHHPKKDGHHYPIKRK